MLKISEKTQAYILVANRKRQQQKANMAISMGVNIPYPVTIEDYMRNHLSNYLCLMFHVKHLERVKE